MSLKRLLLLDEETLPEIEGVDVARGLQRVAGNKRLYCSLLAEFVAKQGPAGVQIASALESGDRNLAERLAHSAKGVAGNMGINVTFQLAGELERAIRESHADVQVPLREFTSELDRQVQAIQRALRVEPRVEQRRESSRKMDQTEALDLVARLRVLLKASDADAATAYVRLKDVLRGIADEAKMDTLGAAISVFDFDVALLKLDEIVKELGGDRK